jgi:glycosyltransferase involved in cell wall biosynthesis
LQENEMKNWPKISVVTPSYNQAEFLERTIKSVLDQNYSCLEYIIIDGGSTDGSVDIIKRYANQLAYWVSEKDKGQTNAINKGFSRATGDVVAWLNSDDEYCPGSLETVARTFMSNKSLNFVFGDRLTIDKDGKILRKDRHCRYCFMALIVLGFIFSQPACFWKRELFDKYGLLDESKRCCMDYEFFCRIGRGLKAKHVRQFFAKYRSHGESKSSTMGDILKREHRDVSLKYLPEVCHGFPVWMVKFYMHVYRTFWYTCQGDFMHVVSGILRRLTPKSRRPPWLVDAP